MPRLLLLLPTSTYRAERFLAAARKAGAEVVVGTDQPHVSEGMASGTTIAVDCSDPQLAADQIVRLDSTLSLDAVVAVDEQGVQAAAVASSRLGLPASSPEAVARTRDKALMREALAQGEVDQPAFAVVARGEPPGAAVSRVGLPCVVKPRSMSASRGVIRADTHAEAEEAVRRTRSIVASAGGSPDASVLVESYVPGVEVAVEGMLQDGVLDVLALFDKPDPLTGPYFEETIYVTPSRLSQADQDTVSAVTERACAAIGLTEGPVHAELRGDVGEDPARFRCIEVAARSIGGRCSSVLSFGTGATLEDLIVRQALHMPTARPGPGSPAAGVMMIPIPAAGHLRAVDGRDAALDVAGVVGIEVTAPVGTWIEPVPEGDRYLGFIFAKGDRPADVEAALRAAHSRLRIRIGPRGRPLA
ncbi:MAG: ATP-grasp domain-containing protein [Actinomycetota bacterium]|nr:ATP-grasp domain-containing protein [Actinomycetota bacterium]